MNIEFPTLADLSASENQIISICHKAWRQKLMPGWSGNASIRIAKKSILITASGTAKGKLQAADLLLINPAGDILSGVGRPSSESLLHITLYENIREIDAILHTHPPYLQALEIALNGSAPLCETDLAKSFLALDLHEASMWRERLRFGANCRPGSRELANSALSGILGVRQKGEDFQEMPLPLGVWLPSHGLCVAGKNLSDCLCLTEEFEHLAHVQLLSRERF